MFIVEFLYDQLLAREQSLKAQTKYYCSMICVLNTYQFSKTTKITRVGTSIFIRT
jgi:hypothetical protein